MGGRWFLFPDWGMAVEIPLRGLLFTPYLRVAFSEGVWLVVAWGGGADADTLVSGTGAHWLKAGTRPPSWGSRKVGPLITNQCDCDRPGADQSIQRGRILEQLEETGNPASNVHSIQRRARYVVAKNDISATARRLGMESRGKRAALDAASEKPDASTDRMISTSRRPIRFPRYHGRKTRKGALKGGRIGTKCIVPEEACSMRAPVGARGPSRARWWAVFSLVSHRFRRALTKVARIRRFQGVPICHHSAKTYFTWRGNRPYQAPTEGDGVAC